MQQHKSENLGAPGTKVRLAWPDVAKGVSILGVCFLHVVLHFPDTAETWAGQINRWLGPIRMPLFFMVSGLFAYKLRSLTLSQLWQRRLRFLVIPYLVWGPIEVLITKWAMGIPFTPETVDETIAMVIKGQCSTWFLQSLAAFILFLWLTKQLPDKLAFFTSFLPYLMLFAITPHAFGAHTIIYLPVYCLGVFFRPLMMLLAQHYRNLWVWLSAAIAFFTAQYAFENDHKVFAWVPNLDEDNMHLFSGALRALGALPFAVLLCAIITELPRLTAFFTFFGRNTLVIYLAHPIMLSLGIKLPERVYDLDFAEVVNQPILFTIMLAYGMALCLFSGWLFEQAKTLPLINKTIDPAAPFYPHKSQKPSGNVTKQSHTNAHS